MIDDSLPPPLLILFPLARSAPCVRRSRFSSPGDPRSASTVPPPINPAPSPALRTSPPSPQEPSRRSPQPARTSQFTAALRSTRHPAPGLSARRAPMLSPTQPSGPPRLPPASSPLFPSFPGSLPVVPLPVPLPLRLPPPSCKPSLGQPAAVLLPGRFDAPSPPARPHVTPPPPPSRSPAITRAPRWRPLQQCSIALIFAFMRSEFHWNPGL